MDVLCSSNIIYAVLKRLENQMYLWKNLSVVQYKTKKRFASSTNVWLSGCIYFLYSPSMGFHPACAVSTAVKAPLN